MKNYKFLKNHLIYEFLDSDVPLGVDPLIIGYERCPSDKEVLHLHKMHYVFTYVFNGKGTLIVGGKTYQVEKNTLLFFPAENITYYPDKNDPWEYMWIEFMGTNTGELLKRANLSAQTPIFRPNQPQKFFEIFANIIEECVIEKQHNNYQYACVASLLQLFYLIIRQRNESFITENEEKNKILAILQYIDTHYSDPDISLKSISNEFFFSPPYLSRMFKKHMNISPVKYIIQQRINKAKKMLQSNQFKIANIAYACGYSSPYYFSLEFKRIVGVSPSKYKQTSIHIE